MKLSLIITSLLITGGLFAQKPQKTSETFVRSESKSQNSSNSRAQLLIWQDDFSIPSNWIIKNNGTPSADWVITTAAPTGINSILMGGLNPANTSASNGYALFDSDALGNATSIQNASIYNRNAIDCSTFTSVVLKFKQYQKKFLDKTFIGLSTDTISWIEIEVNDHLFVNESTQNSETVSLNLSNQLAGESQVFIRFRFEGNWDYAWMIDDVRLETAVDNEIVNQKTWFDMYGKNGGFYTQIPLDLAPTMPISFRSIYDNQGANSQDTLKLKAEIERNSLNIYTGYSDTVELVNVFDSDTLEVIPSNYYASSKANYKLISTLEQLNADDIPLNNTVIANFIVGDSIYARDLGDSDPSRFSSFNYPDGDFLGSGLGTTYDIYDTTRLNSVSVFVHRDTPLGARLRVTLKKPDGSSFTNIAQSSTFIIDDNAKKDKWITLTFSEGIIPINDTTKVYVFAESMEPTKILYIGREWQSIQPENICFINIPSGPNAGLNPIAENYVPYIRLNTKYNAPVSINETTKTDFNWSVYPNPAKNNVTISFENDKKTASELQLIDITGKIIKTVAISSEINKINIPLDNLSKGMYFISLRGNGISKTKKLILN